MEAQKENITESKPIQAVTQAVAGSDLAQLAAAYVDAMGDIDNVVKNANNPHFGSNYADLAAVLDTYKPVFYKYGLALLTAPGAMDGDKISLMWVLMHRSGQRLAGTMQLPIGPKATAQAGGSALTYGRRYLGSAIAGIAQVDDDGNAASEEAPPPKKKAAEKKADKLATAAGNVELLAAIEAVDPTDAKAGDTLTALKPQVKDSGDATLINAWVAKKDQILAAKKAAS